MLSTLTRLIIVLLLAAFTVPALAQHGRPVPKKSEAEKAEEKDEDEKEEEKKDRFLHIKNVDVHPVTGPVERAAEILVKNDKILAIGHDLEVPEDAEILDAMGFRAYPGLVALNGSGLVPIRGGGKPRDGLDPNGLTTTMALAHGITTVLAGTSAVKLVSGTLEGAVLREKVYLGLFYTSRNPRQKAKLREDLTKARAHLRARSASGSGSGASSGRKKPSGDGDEKKAAAKKKDPAAALGSAARYVPLLEGKVTGVFNVTDTHSILEACELAETFGFRAVLRGVVEGWTVADRLGRAGVVAMVIPRVRQDRNETFNRPNGSSIENAAILYRHGVPVAIASQGSSIDMDGQPGKDAIGLTWDAGAAVRGGLPEQAAIEGITITAARCYGLDDRIGSLEEGKDADIVILDGELLHYKSMVQWAIVNGRICYDKEKEPLYRHVRSRDPAFKEDGQWWPRPFAPMPDAWKYDPAAEAKKRAAEEAKKKKDEDDEEKSGQDDDDDEGPEKGKKKPGSDEKK